MLAKLSRAHILRPFAPMVTLYHKKNAKSMAMIIIIAAPPVVAANVPTSPELKLWWFPAFYAHIFVENPSFLFWVLHSE